MGRFERPKPSDPDRIRQSLDRLELAVAGIPDSESFRRYLDVQARFHRYSPNQT